MLYVVLLQLQDIQFIGFPSCMMMYSIQPNFEIEQIALNLQGMKYYKPSFSLNLKPTHRK